MLSRLPTRASSSVKVIPCGLAVRSPVISSYFSTSGNRSTDGVFRELTSMRTSMPWIEALRKRKAGVPLMKEVGRQAERELTPKRMRDSHHSVILPLAQDSWLGDTYLNYTGQIRLGSLFMDLDALSGVIAYKHTGPDVTTVTAAFDRITILNPLTEICDLQLSGQVNWTGRSSMEISLQVAKAPRPGGQVKKEDIMISCTCSMVSLDQITMKPVPINPLILETAEEKRLFAAGKKNSVTKKALAKTSLLKHTPNDEESDIIHALWQKQIRWHDPNDDLRRPSNVLPMEQTVVTTAAIMQPQYRNRHHFMIFGGFLLKQTFELAFCCAASVSHTRPTFISLDPSTFMNPVPVGSVLYLTATVAYTDPPAVHSGATAIDQEFPPTQANQAHNGGDEELEVRSEVGDGVRRAKTRVMIRVDSKVRNVEHGETKPTGQFNYSFFVDRDVRVMPKTYTEFMIYIDARRRAGRVAELASVSHGITE